MLRTLAAAIALTILVGFDGASASAKACRDAHGKFMKCPTAMSSTAHKRCRDAKGKFTKCSAPSK